MLRSGEMSPAEARATLDPVEANRRLAWNELASGALAVKSRPFKASIEITRNSNYKCVMCARYNPNFNMKPALFGRIAEELFARRS